MRKKLMPTTYLLIAVILCVTLHFILPIKTIIPATWNLVGLIPFILGIWVNLAADRELKLAETTVKPFAESYALVKVGVYRFSRNPMYLGFIAILLGVSTLLRTLSPFFIVIAYAIFINTAFIRFEEHKLARLFGDEWHQYRSKVRKWI